MMRKITRREFVQIGSVAVGAAALGGSGLLAACGGSSKDYPVVSMADDKLAIRLSDHPALAAVGGGILFQVSNNTENIVVMHLESGFVATGARCPHKGCSVRWNEDRGLLVCPCHKSEYKPDGTNVRGPGWGKPMPVKEFGKNLTKYNAVLEGDTVIVTRIDV